MACRPLYLSSYNETKKDGEIMSEFHSQKSEAKRIKVPGDFTQEGINHPSHFNFSVWGAY